MGTQRLVGLVVLLGVVLGGIFYFRTKASNTKVVRVCTWSNYFPEAMVEAFTQKTGIKVEFSYFSSNEELFAKLKAGATGFDVIQPSDYMVRQLTALSMLQNLDHSKLPHLSHLDDYYKNLPYDPGFKYSVPFTWGTTGIAVHTGKVKVPEGGIGWDFLLKNTDPKHTSLLDDMREVFSAVLHARGQTPNSKDLTVLETAKQDITQLKDKVLMFTSEPKPLLLKGELTVSHIFSCDAVQAHVENPEIQYYIPKEGGTIWTDNLAIPSTSTRSEEGHVFIDYFLDPENAYTLITTNHLASPNRTAMERLPAEIRNDPNLYPSAEVLKRMHFLEDLGDTLTVINRMWTELKS